jgi:hypothetical protein
VNWSVSENERRADFDMTSISPVVRRLEKTAREEGLLAWRRLSWRQRAEPDFLVIGAQRSGTTSLYAYICEHPRVLPALRKEVHFFDDRFSKGVSWYRAHFPLLQEMQRASDVALTGEGSPYYLFHPAVPGRVAQTLPRVRLIAVLRNPIDRAYSHYQHEVRMRRETLSFQEAVNREQERLADEGQKLLDGRSRFSRNHRSFSYLARGVYVDQLLAWERFFSRDRLLILNSEELFANPDAVLERTFAHLGLPTGASRHYNRKYPGYATMDQTLRNRLAEHFQPHNLRLYQYLGRRFDW